MNHSDRRVTPSDDRDLLGTVVLAAAVGVGATVAIVFISQARFTYRNPQLHLVLETVEALIAFLAGYLMWGRFKRSRSVGDVVLVYALTLLAITNLVFSVLPDVVGASPMGVTRAWAAVAMRAIGAVGFAVAALLAPRAVTNVRKSSWVLVYGLLGTIALVFVLAKGFESSLPAILESDLPPEASGRPAIASHPSFTVIQAAVVVPYALAAWGFLKRYVRTGDDLMGWLGAASILSAFARVQYALYPSLYSQFVHTGDFLRLAFYLLLLAGATREIRTHWESMARTVALEERSELAHYLHDGLAQEMTFLAGQVARLKKTPHPDPEMVGSIQRATSRSLAEARRAVTALSDPIDRPFGAILREVALQIFPEAHPRLQLDLDVDVRVSPRRRERLIRVIREALVNTKEHADASSVRVRLVSGEPLVITVRDDGRGFDPSAKHPGFGLITMRERVRSMGGELSVESELGRGTTIEMRIP